MPTGYTYQLIGEKEVSFNEFIMNCALAFGACFSLRDARNPVIPKEFEVSYYHLEAFQKLNDQLNELMKMSDEEKQKQVDNYNNETKSRYEKDI